MAQSKCVAGLALAGRRLAAQCALLTWSPRKRSIRRVDARTHFGWPWRASLKALSLDDEQVYEALDLCLECRACKTECPAGVDMASLKSEFLANYWTKHGTPLRARALANVEGLASMGQPFRSGLSNLDRQQLTSSPAQRNACWILIADDRFPEWKRNTFTPLAQQKQTHLSHPKLSCCSTTHSLNYYDPEIGIAALQVLEKSGCAYVWSAPVVVVAPSFHKDCLPRPALMPRKWSKACFRWPTRGIKSFSVNLVASQQ